MGADLQDRMAGQHGLAHLAGRQRDLQFWERALARAAAGVTAKTDRDAVDRRVASVLPERQDVLAREQRRRGWCCRTGSNREGQQRGQNESSDGHTWKRSKTPATSR